MINIDLFFTIFSLRGASPVIDTVMVFGAEYLIFVMVLFSLFIAATGKPERRALLLILISEAVSLILLKTVHHFYFEPRPFVTYHLTPLISHIADTGFPSSHTTYSSVMAFSLILTKSKWRWVMLGLALWVGISRIFVGVHYPIDILGGLLTGGLGTILGWQILKHTLKRTVRFKWSHHLQD